MANNPIRYVDPSGHSWLDAISEFTTGFVAEIDRSFLGYTPQLQEFYGPDPSESDAMLVGRLTADVVEIVVGIAAIDVGAGGVLVGAGACATGVGCPGGVVVAAGGVVVVGVGAIGVTQGAIGIGQNLALLSKRDRGSSQGSSSSGGGVDVTKLRKVSDNFLKQHGIDPHELKAGQEGNPDIYMDSNGNLYAVPKNAPKGTEPQFLGNIDE